jgi:repressor LexA
MSFSEILNNLLSRNKKTAYRMSKETGISERLIGYWKNGKVPEGENLKKVADYFNVSVDYLLGNSTLKNRNIGNYPPNSNQLSDIMEKLGALPIGELINVPILGSVKAGFNGIAYEEIVGYEPMPKEFLDGNDDCFLLRIRGDSMAPLMTENDLVLVHHQSSVDSGSYAIVIVDGEEGVVKKVTYGADWIELHSENPYYPVRRFDGQDVLQVYIAGEVIRQVRKFKP